LQPDLAFEPVVLCRRLATRHRVGDVSADMEGRGAGGPVPGAFLSTNRSPREGGALLAQLPGPNPRPVERRVAPAQCVGGGVGHRIGEHWQNETFGIPEGVAVVPWSRQTLGRDGALLGAGASLEGVKEPKAYGLLKLRVTLQLHVGALPEIIQ